MARALVLGAGFGGISAALELRRLLDRQHEVVLVDDAASFRMGLGNLWMLDGRRKMGEGRRPLALLGAKGIQVLRGRVDRIAGHLAHELTGRSSDAKFEGKGTCFIELGQR